MDIGLNGNSIWDLGLGCCVDIIDTFIMLDACEDAVLV